MYRFTNYFLAYIFFTIIHSINVFGSLSNSFYFFAFLISTFLLVFKFEYLPTKYLSDPRVHYYSKSRLNSFGYSMIILIISSILLYSTFSFYLGSNASDLITIIWPINFLISIFLSRKFANEVPENAALDFIRQELNIYERNKITSIEKYIESIDRKLEKPDQHLSNLTTEEKIKVITLFAKYRFRNKDKLISDEIRDL